MAIGDRHIVLGLYSNANYYASAIVASITEGIDWSAYFNGCDPTIAQEDAAEQVAREGDKLSEKLARFIFPNINLPYRR
jgi:hypothetical protein